jgi:transposase-like protein
MARFVARYTDQQKDALLKAVLVDGLSIAEAARRAPHGRLGVDAFDVNRQYAYDLVKKGRDGYEERNPEALELATANELRRLHRLNLKRSRGLTEASDPDEIKRAAQALSATRSAMRGPGGSKPKVHEPAPAPETPAPRGDDVLTRLLGNKKSPAGAGP